MPTFSVIVPVYKVEPYLDECIQSILNQTYKDFELILVDDGSPDKCPQICDSYAALDNRVKVIHKPNGGVTSARNAGVQSAIGEYLVFVDGDDFIGETLLEKLSYVLYEHPVDMVAFGYTDFKENEPREEHCNALPIGKYMGESLRVIKDSFLFKVIDNKITRRFFYHSLWCKSIKRELFWDAQKMIPKDIKKGEDAAAIILLLGNCSQIYVTDVCEYYYRYVSSSVMNSFNENLLRSHRILFDFLKKNCKTIPEYTIVGYAKSLLDAELIKAARCYNTYSEFCAYIKTKLANNFDDVLDAFLKIKLPMREKIKFFVMRRRWFCFYWLYYHRNNS